MATVDVFDSKGELLASAAQSVIESARDAIAARGSFSIALTGGSVAKELHPVIPKDAIDWSKTKIWFGDERCVAPDDPESNYKLAKDTLLDRVGVPASNVFRMRGEEKDADAAAREYEKTLPAAFDLVILGMGPDGHICSLFPGFPQLKETARRVVFVDGSPKPPPKRITVTPPVVSSARRILTIAMSADKADAVARALAAGGSIEQTPARLAREGAWMLTREAAAKLAR